MSDDTDSEPSRSERLRKRRSQSSETHPDAVADDTTSATATSRADTADGSTSSSPAADPSSVDGTVKDEQVGTYMYIPKDQKKKVQRQYNVLKAEYEYEFETTFEKNRHFYPLLIQYGLDSLDGLDATEIQEHLDSIS